MKGLIVKQFITEQQLYLYKYQPNSKYFGDSLASILLQEATTFFEITKNGNEDIFSFFEHFLHRKVNRSNTVYYFDDDSVFIIKEEQINGEKLYYFSCSVFGFISE